MNTTSADIIRSSTNYHVIVPISMCFVIISIFVSFGILILIYSIRRLHTITHILICNTCISSILYSIVQSNNYIYLIFISWETSDVLCRCRAYFGYMSIAAVIYSYVVQALSRYLFSIFHTNHRRMLTFRTHYIIILIQWIIVMIIPLPALVTKDIYYRPTFLCWVPKGKFLHVMYTLFAYYLIPITFIIGIYLNIYKRIKHIEKTSLETIRKIKQNRNLEILRNILILIGIYTCGGIPIAIYLITRIEIFYSIGIVVLSLFVAVEKLITILLDREMRNCIKDYFCRSTTTTAIAPIIVNYHQNIIQPKLTDCKTH